MRLTREKFFQKTAEFGNRSSGTGVKEIEMKVNLFGSRQTAFSHQWGVCLDEKVHLVYYCESEDGFNPVEDAEACVDEVTLCDGSCKKYLPHKLAETVAAFLEKGDTNGLVAYFTEMKRAKNGSKLSLEEREGIEKFLMDEARRSGLLSAVTFF